ALAASTYQIIWQRFPNQPETLVGWAQSLRLTGQDDRSQEILRHLDSLALDAEQYYKVALAFKQFEDPVNAARFASKVVRYTPDSIAGSYHYRALYLLQA